MGRFDAAQNVPVYDLSDDTVSADILPVSGNLPLVQGIKTAQPPAGSGGLV